MKLALTSQPALRALMENLTHAVGSEGIWYVVRTPTEWRLISYRYDDFAEEKDHTQLWEDEVVPFLSFKWKLKKSQIADLTMAPYAFPRGRVTRALKGFTIHNGEDFAKFVSKQQIARAFSLFEGFTFSPDDHERCQVDDKQLVRAMLNLKEDWPAVE
jgi:hypothetical protein